MDLLRLVLARQSISKLALLPRLLNSRRFVVVRREIYNLPLMKGQGVGPLERSILAGDLCPQNVGTVPTHFSLVRAVFLRNSAAFLHFAWEDDISTDFWYAMGSGIPEIQQYVIDWVKRKLVERKIPDYEMVADLNSIPDEATIPWTSELKAEFRSLVEFLIQDMKILPADMPRLCGIADLDIGDAAFGSQGSKETYIIARVLSMLNYKPTFHIVPEVDNFLESRGWESRVNFWSPFRKYMSMGYYLPLTILLNEHRAAFDITPVKNMARAALRDFRYDILYHISRKSYVTDLRDTIGSQFSFGRLITRLTIIDARKCLNDLNIRNLMVPEVLVIYRIIAGEILPDTVSTPFRNAVGNPGQLVGTLHRRGSIEGLAFYDPLWLFNIERNSYTDPLVRTYLASRGKIILS